MGLRPAAGDEQAADAEVSGPFVWHHEPLTSSLTRQHKPDVNAPPSPPNVFGMGICRCRLWRSCCTG